MNMPRTANVTPTKKQINNSAKALLKSLTFDMRPLLISAGVSLPSVKILMGDAFEVLGVVQRQWLKEMQTSQGVPAFLLHGNARNLTSYIKNLDDSVITRHAQADFLKQEATRCFHKQVQDLLTSRHPGARAMNQ